MEKCALAELGNAFRLVGAKFPVQLWLAPTFDKFHIYFC
jgi:hypothetical protein